MQWQIALGAVALTLACVAQWKQRRSRADAPPPATGTGKTRPDRADVLNPSEPVSTDNRIYQFIASLKLGTPLSVLDHHREVRRGPRAALPAYGGPAGGMWVLKEEAGIEMKAPRADSKLAFLKDFRRIVESGATPERKRQALLDLAARNEDYSRMIATHRKANPNWVDEWVGYEEALGLTGIGSGTARKLYDAGYRRSADLRKAGDREIGAIKGIGPVTLSKIRELLAQRPAGA